MLVYIIPFIYCLACIYYFDYLKNRSQATVFYNALLVYLILLAGLSYRIGGDSGFYMEGFRDIPDLSQLNERSFDVTSYQPFYFLLCVVCKTIEPEIWFMHLCQSWIVCAVMFHFIKKRTRYIFTGALLFMACMYTYFCFEIYKESLAVSMMLLGYPYLEKKKYVKYYVFAFCALMFHYSGVVAFFIPFVRNIRFNKRFFVWLAVMFGVIVLLRNYASYIFLNDAIREKWEYYLYVASDRYNINWFIDSFLRNVSVPLIAGLWLKYVYKGLPFEWAYCLYALLGIGTLEYALIFERPINYVLPFVVLSLSEMAGRSYYTGGMKKLGTAIVCIVFWFGARGLFYAREEGWRLMIPYESILTKEVNAERERVVREIH